MAHRTASDGSEGAAVVDEEGGDTGDAMNSGEMSISAGEFEHGV